MIDKASGRTPEEASGGQPTASPAEKRIFVIGSSLVLAGGLLCWPLFGAMAALAILVGGALAGLNLAWLRHSIGALVFHDPKRSKRRVLLAFFLRLLLTPLCLYATMRLLFLGAPALIAGFALFLFSVLVEGILEALGHGSG